nr:MAG TPA: hypothetical protein [Caudoviricetes sp.]
MQMIFVFCHIEKNDLHEFSTIYMCRKRRKKASSHFQRHFFAKEQVSKTERANKLANAFLRFVMSRKA